MDLDKLYASDWQVPPQSKPMRHCQQHETRAASQADFSRCVSKHPREQKKLWILSMTNYLARRNSIMRDPLLRFRNYCLLASPDASWFLYPLLIRWNALCISPQAFQDPWISHLAPISVMSPSLASWKNSSMTVTTFQSYIIMGQFKEAPWLEEGECRINACRQDTDGSQA